MKQDHYYSIGEVSEMVGVPSSTIRFYDKKGLLPNVSRSEGGIRRFSQADVNWLHMIESMKLMGMSIAEISELTLLSQQGEDTFEKRRKIVHEKRDEIVKKLEEMEKTLDLINYMCCILDKAVETGSLNLSLDLLEEKLPDDIKNIGQIAVSLEAAKEFNKQRRNSKKTKSDSE